MKKNISVLIIGILLFYWIVLGGTLVIPHEAGMLFMMVLLFAVNPVYFVLTGILAGMWPGKSWFLPVAAGVIFAGSYAFILDMKEWGYSVIYVVLAYVAMGITLAVIKRTKRTS